MVNMIRSLGLQGIAGYEVQVECALSGGLPAFDVVGLPDAAVKESRERVRAAIKACGAKFPVSRITINLAPAALRKEGTVYDLPILLGILAALVQICLTYSYRMAPAGEVSVYNYSGIIFSMIFGYLILGQAVGVTSILGGALVIGASLLVYFYNRKHEPTNA